jgi:sulfite exporter TauE/SafE
VVTLVLGAGFAGLVGSPHCLGMCGGFAAACSGDRAGSAAWHAGRLSTYAGLGALAATAGRILPVPAWGVTVFAALLLVWFAAGIAGITRPPHVAVPGLARVAAAALARSGRASRFALGLCSGLIPCGLVYAALAVPVASADPAVGAVAMIAFGLGTVPALALAATGLRRVLAGTPWRRRVMAAGVLVGGLAALATRAPASPEDPPCHPPAVTAER